MRLIPKAVRDIITWLWGLDEFGDALAGDDVLLGRDASDGLVKRLLMSRIATYVQGALSISSGQAGLDATAVTNVSSVAVNDCLYIESGDVVACAIVGLVDPTASGAIEFKLAPPVGAVDVAYGMVARIGTIDGGYAVADAGEIYVSADATSGDAALFLVIAFYKKVAS